jgi:hypothetical protein
LSAGGLKYHSLELARKRYICAVRSAKASSKDGTAASGFFDQKPDLCANVIGYEQGYFPTFEEILLLSPPRILKTASNKAIKPENQQAKQESEH